MDAMSLALGAAASSYADYFETCRHKGNEIDYTRSHVSTDGEAAEIVRARSFTSSWRRGLNRSFRL